jgi:hypothetical protein
VFIFGIFLIYFFNYERNLNQRNLINSEQHIIMSSIYLSDGLYNINLTEYFSSLERCLRYLDDSSCFFA